MTVARILENKGYKVYTAREDAPLMDVIHELAEHKIGVLVVTNPAGEITGMVSERDVVREMAKNGLRPGATASEIMTRKVCKCAPDDTEGEVMERMGKAAVRHLPVEHHGKLVGLISARDILRLRIEKLDALMQDVMREVAQKA